MGENYTYNATHLTTVREAEFTQSAELGAVGTFRLALDDEAGTLAIIGQKDFSHTESSCSFTRTFKGFVGDREYGRDAGLERSPHVGAGRGIGISGEDLNATLGFRLINDQLPDVTSVLGGKRPSETVAARLTWLMASSFVSGLFIDNGRITSNTTVMDKADYRQQFPGDVLADCALAATGFNYYVADWGSGAELVFRNDNTSTADTSTLRLSNVLADASGVTLHPFKDATLRRSPGRVKSKIAYSHAKGTVVVQRAATATAFNGERAGTASNSNVKTDAEAERQAKAELGQLRTEEDIIECTVLVTSAQVNLILAGHRIEAKFSHLNVEGYGSFSWFRVLERNVKPIVADAGLYELRLKLSPQEATDAVVACSDLYANTPSATYYPIGGSANTPNPTPSPGVVYYFRPGITYPVVPTPGHQGSWHFPALSAGGLGNIDYGGDCVQNHLILMTVGNGTWTIQTERYAGSLRTLAVSRGPNFPSVALVQTIVSGDSVAVTISDAVAGDCIRVVVIKDPGYACGSKWGWSSAAWVAA